MLEKVFAAQFEAIQLPARLQQLKDAVSAVRQLSNPGAHQVVSIGFSLADSRLAELSRGSGATALAANRSLDAALELFAAAQRWDERELGSPLSFARLQLELGVPEDSLAPIGTKPAVVLATPAQISKSYKLVAMPRLQEGIWPNLTPRNSLLGATSLQAFLVGRQDSPQTPARSELADELRMFYRACGSATEQLLLSAIEDETEQPSQFFQMAKLEPELNRESIDFDLRRVVGRLRRRLYHGDASAAATLAAMALAGLPGAHPENWQGLLPLSREDGIAASDIRVSASKFESFERCPLHWFISSFGGDQGGFQASVGTLLHAALEAASSGADPADFVDQSWHTVEFESEWLANKSRREAAQMVGLISEYLASSAELVAAEKGFRVTIGSLQVSGRIDRIERSEQGLEAVDLKTGKKMPSQAEMASHRQLAIYQLAIESTYDEKPAGGRLVSVGSNKVKTLAQPALSQELRDELTEVAGAIQGQLENGLFTARIDEHCEKNGSCQLLIGRVITGG
jgi:RecB family exonuclease